MLTNNRKVKPPMADEGFIPKGQIVEVNRNMTGQLFKKGIEAIVIQSTGRSSWDVLLTEDPHKFKCINVRSSQFQPKVKEAFPGLYGAVLPKGQDGETPIVKDDFIGSRNIIVAKDVEKIAQLIKQGIIVRITEEKLFGAQNAELQTCK